MFSAKGSNWFKLPFKNADCPPFITSFLFPLGLTSFSPGGFFVFRGWAGYLAEDLFKHPLKQLWDLKI
jgi:hypothetical protein